MRIDLTRTFSPNSQEFLVSCLAVKGTNLSGFLTSCRLAELTFHMDMLGVHGDFGMRGLVRIRDLLLRSGRRLVALDARTDQAAVPDVRRTLGSSSDAVILISEFAKETQNPGRLICSPRRTTGTVPGC